jgi:mono/diheme cytochrome c family protein
MELAMPKGACKWLIVANVIIGFNSSGWAQDVNAGKTAYLSSCAPCHGADAKGTGTLGLVLRLQPPDLTVLAKRNDGEFPARAVNEIIDGITFIQAHGTREMPIWGFDVMVKTRITAIVDYLRSIQEK